MADPQQIAVILPATAFFLCVLYTAAYRPVIFVGFLFILFSLVWRTASTAYIDLAGPVWSSQTVRDIGPGLATPLHVLAYFTTLAPFFVMLNPARIDGWLEGADQRRAAPGKLTLSDVTVALSALFLAYLIFDLIRIGSIPLFAHIERYVYTAQHAGAAHRWLVQYGNFLVFWWGLMVAAEWLRNHRIDFRYLALLGVLLLYMFVAGNRFSAFYSYCSFFVLPLAVPIASAIGGSRSQVPFFWIWRLCKTRDLIILSAAAVLTFAIAAFAIYNNMVSVRGYQDSEVTSQLLERVLIQPGELGWISYERIFMLGKWQPERVYDFLFQTPVDPSRNTTPQFLMLETIGEPRTYEHISGGFQFAGGFPEIFFELFGPIFAWPFLFGCGYIAASLSALIIKSTIQGRYASAFLSLYVLYGFDVMYIGGMLNFIAVQTYWIKITALVLALLMESRLARSELSLVPWTVFELPHSNRLATAYGSFGAKFRNKANRASK